MNAIYLIIIYLIICLSIVLFNIFIILFNKKSNNQNVLKINDYKSKIKEQLQLINNGNNVDSTHLNYLKKKLKNGNELMIYDQIITSYKLREKEGIDIYLNECKKVLINLIYFYEKRSNTELAYFLSVIRDYGILENNNNNEVEKILFQTLRDESFYCRDNAYLAICKLANPNKLCDALLNIGNSNKYFHKNLITNGLNIYNGNHQELEEILLNNFKKFENSIKCSIIDYLAFNDYPNSKFIYNIMLETKDRNLLLSCINYFEYINYKLSEDFLIKNVEKYFDTDIELCIACVKALRNYKSKKSINILKKAIYSSEFRIRDAACESLAVIRLCFKSKDFEEFMFEDEANDMYNYHIRKNESKQVK